MSTEAETRGPLPKPGPPPYTDCWSEEKLLTPTVVATPRGIAFRDEVPHDRDGWGVLWARRALRRGQGRALYGTVHTQRQRAVMRRLTCHVCNGPADRDSAGVLWVIEDRRGAWADWPEGVPTTHPPLCTPCGARAARECHYLARTLWVPLRVRRPQVIGVHGTPYRLDEDSGLLRPGGDDFVRYDQEPEIRWVLARQAAVALFDCTLLDPGVLLTT
ncbi:hypothetical protein F0L17_09470 [Streptomyces sp. TRM43335]|uniref:Uncharacterized protein n=1 Tax=Streptomyces taklimakanensis TaxID=2569853 RepID=A0A6G2BBS4_9ACTN|nr:hypothetical protein [Streptomyces taklimakanensis]MTE19352.1 hypothetical protein [Streptomyces taklimakanensis]